MKYDDIYRSSNFNSDTKESFLSDRKHNESNLSHRNSDLFELLGCHIFTGTCHLEVFSVAEFSR